MARESQKGILLYIIFNPSVCSFQVLVQSVSVPAIYLKKKIRQKVSKFFI